MKENLSIWIDDWVYQYFAPEVQSYCDILLNRITPIFDDLDGEETRAARTFLDAIPAHDEDNHDATVEAAYECVSGQAVEITSATAGATYEVENW